MQLYHYICYSKIVWWSRHLRMEIAFPMTFGSLMYSTITKSELHCILIIVCCGTKFGTLFIKPKTQLKGTSLFNIVIHIVHALWYEGCKANSPPTLTGVGHQWTVSPSASCNQWLSLAKPCLKVLPAGRNRSLVARTSKCGWAIKNK
jgi:hypothetical protein